MEGPGFPDQAWLWHKRFFCELNSNGMGLKSVRVELGTVTGPKVKHPVATYVSNDVGKHATVKGLCP